MHLATETKTVFEPGWKYIYLYCKGWLFNTGVKGDWLAFGAKPLVVNLGTETKPSSLLESILKWDVWCIAGTKAFVHPYDNGSRGCDNASCTVQDWFNHLFLTHWLLHLINYIHWTDKRVISDDGKRNVRQQSHVVVTEKRNDRKPLQITECKCLNQPSSALVPAITAKCTV